MEEGREEGGGKGVDTMLKLELLEIFIFKTEELISAVGSLSRIV